ncbi:MAG: hypothetical protein JKY65_25885 [Planctomycetes bacterium]|nr:hypothetical protein [Planctomycetota bacterium]
MNTRPLPTICLSLLLCAPALAGQRPTGKGSVDEDAKWTVYTPPGMTKKKRPVLVCFDPAANSKRMLETWGPVADELKWFLLVSKTSKNGGDMGAVARSLSKDFKALKKKHAFDAKRVAATGYSGGGMTSHYLAMVLPKEIRAVIPNTGMIHPQFRNPGSYPKRKIVAFLASPTDRRYGEMKKDKALLESLKWKVKWVEFKGGHVIATHEACLEAANFVEASWRKKK